MEMNRRGFLGYLLGAAALAAPVIGIFAQGAPRRIVEAVRSRRYPGPLVDHDEISIGASGSSGPWAG
jgi:hypothetical protein